MKYDDIAKERGFSNSYVRNMAMNELYAESKVIESNKLKTKVAEIIEIITNSTDYINAEILMRDDWRPNYYNLRTYILHIHDDIPERDIVAIAKMFGVRSWDWLAYLIGFVAWVSAIYSAFSCDQAVLDTIQFITTLAFISFFCLLTVFPIVYIISVLGIGFIQKVYSRIRGRCI